MIVAAEESKGLGKYFFEPDSTDDGLCEPCTEEDSETDPTCTEEIGKNQWYFSFDMGTPDTSAGIDNPNSLVENLVNQGNMLNQGEVYWETGELFGLMSTEDMEDYGDLQLRYPQHRDRPPRQPAGAVGIGKATASANGLAAISVLETGHRCARAARPTPCCGVSCVPDDLRCRRWTTRTPSRTWCVRTFLIERRYQPVLSGRCLCRSGHQPLGCDSGYLHR